jgi:NAD(P)-dependent dehydrogenase (short-subunit alcohol dehydrogenase family)
VVNIASTAGKWGSMNQSAYNASKHALVGLTRCAALEMGGFNVNVNAICPGFVQTDMLGEFKAHAAIQGVPFETVLENGRNRVPLKRFLQARGDRQPGGLPRLRREQRHDRAVAADRRRHGDGVTVFVVSNC